MKDPQKVITIEAVSDKPENKKAAIKGDDGNWYEIWKQWESSNTDAYNQFLYGNHNEPFKKGDQAIITYKEGLYNGKSQYTIRSIFPVDGQNQTQTTLSSSPAKSAQSEANKAFQSNSNDAFGRRLALHGFVNAMLSRGATIEVIIKDLPALGKLEDAIDRYLNEPQALTQMREKFGNTNQDDEPPIEAYNDEPDVSDIPF